MSTRDQARSLPCSDKEEKMATTRETITVACPFCRESHTYALEVQRDPVTEFILMRPPELPGCAAAEKSFTRIFTCPTTGRDFQAKITVPQPRGTKVSSVDVEGPTGTGV